MATAGCTAAGGGHAAQAGAAGAPAPAARRPDMPQVLHTPVCRACAKDLSRVGVLRSLARVPSQPGNAPTDRLGLPLQPSFAVLLVGCSAHPKLVSNLLCVPCPLHASDVARLSVLPPGSMRLCGRLSGVCDVPHPSAAAGLGDQPLDRALPASWGLVSQSTVRLQQAGPRARLGRSHLEHCCHMGPVTCQESGWPAPSPSLAAYACLWSQAHPCLQDWRTHAVQTAEPRPQLLDSVPAARSWQRVPWHQSYRSDFEMDEDGLGRCLLCAGAHVLHQQAMTNNTPTALQPPRQPNLDLPRQAGRRA